MLFSQELRNLEVRGIFFCKYLPHLNSISFSVDDPSSILSAVCDKIRNGSYSVHCNGNVFEKEQNHINFFNKSFAYGALEFRWLRGREISSLFSPFRGFLFRAPSQLSRDY